MQGMPSKAQGQPRKNAFGTSAFRDFLTSEGGYDVGDGNMRGGTSFGGALDHYEPELTKLAAQMSQQASPGPPLWYPTCETSKTCVTVETL